MQPDFDEIEHLIIQQLSGLLPVEEEERLLQQIEGDADLKALYAEYRETLQLYKAGHTANQIDELQAWDKIAGSITEEAPLVVMVPWWRRWQVAVACMFLLTAGSWWGWQAYHHSAVGVLAQEKPAVMLKLANGRVMKLTAAGEAMQVKNGTSATLRLQDGSVLADASRDKIVTDELNTLSIPEGKDYYLKLADGSEVWLNAATDLQFPLAFNGKQRLVKVKGEAYFKIAPDASVPFVVNANGMDIQVLGTEFNTKCYDGEPAATSLVTGKVAVNVPGTQAYQLMPGQELQKSGAQWEVASFDASVTLAWLKGLYLFNNEPLQLIKNNMERWYGVQVRIAPGMASKRFSGAMEKNKSVELFLRNLSRSSDLRYTLQGNEVHIF